ANCFAIAVPYPQPAMTGTRPLVCCTAAETTLANSGMVSEKNSPVPPAAKRPAGPCCRSHSICSLYVLAANPKSRVKWVTGNDSSPPPILFASSSGAILSIAVLYLEIRGAKTQFTAQDSITSARRSTPLPRTLRLRRLRHLEHISPIRRPSSGRLKRYEGRVAAAFLAEALLLRSGPDPAKFVTSRCRRRARG